MTRRLLTRPDPAEPDWLEPLPVEPPPPPFATPTRPRPPSDSDLAQWAGRLADGPRVLSPGAAFSPRFVRLLDISPRELPDALRSWWRANARDGSAVLARALRVGEPYADRRETWTMTGRLRVMHRLPIAVDVLMWPHLGYWTKLTLEPHAPTRVGHMYFRRGHAALDELRTALVSRRARP